MAFRSVTSRGLGTIAAALVVAALVASAGGCGGGGGRAAGPGGGVPPASATGFTQGVITGFGTIHMGSGTDEKVFHVEDAVLERLDDGVRHDGLDDDQVVFRVGMKVQVFHDGDKASEVRFMDELEGPITAKPSTVPGATFDVLGVPVRVDRETHFDDSIEHSGLTLAGLTVGNVIELSGDFDAGGVLHATFIEGEHATATGRTFEIKGHVSGLAGASPNQTFTVNGATFTMNSSSVLRDMPAGLADGALVEVKTQSTTAPFVVTRIEGLAGDFDEAEAEVRGADEASVEGFIVGLTGTSPTFSFTLAGTPVVTSAATAGLTLVRANAHIEAEGPVGANGEIKAVKITSRP